VDFETIRVTSQAQVYDLLLTATSPVSHHDPAVQDDSNVQLQNRRKQLLHREEYWAQEVPQAAIDRFCAANPVPPDVVDVLRDTPFPFYAACALTVLFLDAYNTGDGYGVFSGPERYGRLNDRMAHAAQRAFGLFRYWDLLCDSLQVPVFAGRENERLMGFLALPRGLQEQMLRAIHQDHRAIGAVARQWHTLLKCRDPKYAAEHGSPVTGEPAVPTYAADEIAPGSPEVVVAEVPCAVTANSLRHQVVREPGMLHLFGRLGLTPGIPGQGPVPPGVEALFDNGGNIDSGAKEPTGAFLLGIRVRQMYPLLDLLSGCCDGFNLGEGRLQCHSVLICRENREALAGTPAEDDPAVEVSAYDLLDNETITRQAGRTGLGQMIVNSEVLAAGARMLFRCILPPHTPTLTHGAYLAAVRTYLDNVPSIAGGAARGYGFVRAEWAGKPDVDGDPLVEYEAHIDANREQLRAGLCDGTFCTGSVLVS